jgi:hypothetical protein
MLPLISTPQDRSALTPMSASPQHPLLARLRPAVGKREWLLETGMGEVQTALVTKTAICPSPDQYLCCMLNA